jgi:xylose isomerase
MLAGSPYPYYIHINDNNGRWDWDFMVASDNYLEYVEFLFYLQEFGYRDFLTSDTSPTRWDIVGTFEANIRMTQKIWNRLLEINRPKFKKLIHGGDFLATWKFLEKNIFAL